MIRGSSDAHVPEAGLRLSGGGGDEWVDCRPDVDEALIRSGDEVLTVGRERGTDLGSSVLVPFVLADLLVLGRVVEPDARVVAADQNLRRKAPGNSAPRLVSTSRLSHASVIVSASSYVRSREGGATFPGWPGWNWIPVIFRFPDLLQTSSWAA